MTVIDKVNKLNINSDESYIIGEKVLNILLQKLIIMKLKIFKNSFLFPMTIGIVLLVISCVSITKKEQANINMSMRLTHDDSLVVVGANQTDNYLSILKNKNVGIVANQTSVIFKEEGEYTHLVDSLLSLGINVTKVFAPEHGFRGTADAGEHIKEGLDTKTGLPIISLYPPVSQPFQLKERDIPGGPEGITRATQQDPLQIDVVRNTQRCMRR